MTNTINFTKTKGAISIYGAVSLFLAFACVALRAVSILFFYDKEIGYYNAGAVLPIILNVFITLSVAFPLVFAVIPALRLSPRFPDGSRSRFAGIIPAIGFAVFSVICIIGLKSQLEEIKELELLSPEKLSLYVKIYPILLLVASVCGCVFFALSLFNSSSSLIAPTVITGVMAVIWFVISAADSYFDTFVQMNAPNKLTFMMGTLSATLFTVSEARRGFSVRKSHTHLFGTTVAAIFTLTSAIPSLICYFTGNMPQNYTLLFFDVVLLTVGIYALVRLIALCFGKDRPWITVTVSDREEQCDDSSETPAEQDEIIEETTTI